MSSNTKNNLIAIRNRARNKRYKLAIKKSIKKYLLSLQNSKQKFENQPKDNLICFNNLSIVYKRIDRAVKRNVLHRNTAARKKSKLARMLN